MDIVIAEDDKISLSVLKNILKKSGHRVLTAENGMVAWDLLNQNKTYRVLITDWEMPEMSGIDLCKKIRAADFPYYIYIIVVTSRESKEDAISGLEAGADDFLSKPINNQELRARVMSGERLIKLEDERRKMNSQLLQSEKMASIGQLAAGVAHEINNPTGFVSSNLKTLTDYQQDLDGLIALYKELISMLKTQGSDNHLPDGILDELKKIDDFEEKIDLEFIMGDLVEILNDCIEGTDRIKKIVIDLKDFAHPGEDQRKVVDINKCIESTLNVVWSELKYKATVVKDYGELPFVNCYPNQINHVVMNILVNAAQAIEENGEIRIVTSENNGMAEIRISDTGCGIAEENLLKIFDPFFTTKEVGKGTGLGMNVAYNIIEKHGGGIDVSSKVGVGTTFKIRIPVEREG